MPPCPQLRFLWLAMVGLLVGSVAEAASLQPVSNWGASGVPSYVSMYIYVPDKMATNPPILVGLALGFAVCMLVRRRKEVSR